MSHTGRSEITSVEVSNRSIPPSWAVKERFLMDLMNRAAMAYVERYTNPDGTFVFRDEWPGMDGSDDAYESFTTFPLFYALGGDEKIHELARKEWSAITWQFTEYGTVHNEFDAYYDWMHHGESYTYIYYLALANPYAHQDRMRALKFAGMYTGDDPNAPNWDPEHKMLRSPITGGKGPCFKMTAEDWTTHRPVLANYLVPYEDLEGIDASDPMVKADWNDDEIFGRILDQMNARMVPGDVPLNLASTSLVTSAFLYTGQEDYKRWVIEYLDAWKQRTEENGGITPDNIGPNGKIGERMDGKWWGGYYGYRWPHGARNMLEATTIAGCNAVLLTGDLSHLELSRSQHDRMWSLGREEDGVFKEPMKYGDSGWFQYAPPDPRLTMHLYNTSQSQEDWDRLQRFANRETWANRGNYSKGAQYHPAPWFAFVTGSNPGHPDRVLDHVYGEISRRMEKMRNDDGDPQEWDVHHWQEINPVVIEPIVQLAMGTPAAIYHGGLLHARVRYFDPLLRRPGLPRHVAALVESISPEGITLSLVNTDPLDHRKVLLQAGAFGEHAFSELRVIDEKGQSGDATTVNSKHLQIDLGPSTHARFEISMGRYVNMPTYDFPWQDS